MKNLKTILVVIDPTVEHDFVLDRAKLIAKATGARVSLFVNSASTLNERTFAYEGIDSSFFENQHKLFEEHHQQLLKRVQAEFATDNISTTLVFSEHHNLAEAIVAQTFHSKADLVMKSTHHHSVIERTLITNTDWRLIRKCPAALMLVKPNKWQASGSIVTAVDPLHAKAEQSTLDHLLLESTEFFSGKVGQTPWVFHSYFPFVHTYLSGSQNVEFLKSIREQHEEKLQQLMSSHGIPKTNFRLSKGEIVPKLLEYLTVVAANLLVIGALSRNVLERAIVGNTAEKILEQCPCDVLIIKAPKAK